MNMLSGRETISAYTRANVCIWMVLAFQAGLLNMGGLLGCQSFVSHVTGFATTLGLDLSRMDMALVRDTLIVPVFFLSGAMLSGFLVDIRLKLREKPGYDIVFGVMFLELLVVVIGGFNHVFGDFGKPHHDVLLALLALICGTQNGLITLVSKSVVRTTHLSGLTTDLGVGLARVWNRRRLHREDTEHEGRDNLMRIGIFCFFTLGGVAGVKVFTTYGFRGFLIPTAITGCLFLLSLQRVRRVFWH